MHKVIQFIKTRPLFLLLLPFFFFLHILNENFAPVLFNDCFLLILAGMAMSLCLYGLFFLFYKNSRKAALLSFFIIAFVLFFGSMYDFVLAKMGRIFLLKYTVIIPAFLLVTLLIAVYLKRTRRTLLRIVFYLNSLLLLLTLWELFIAGNKSLNLRPIHTADISQQLNTCDTCSKPDIYLIVADEYAGAQELKDLFSFDNSAFEQQLESRGFHITHNSFSNYNATVYSMASALNMGYLESLNTTMISHKDMFNCQEQIRKNQLTAFLQTQGYDIINHSFFDLGNKDKLVSIPFFPKKRDIFLAQTLFGHMEKHLGFHWATDEKIEAIRKVHYINNNIIDSSTSAGLRSKKQKPVFTYTHLALPHNPYFYDSTGNKIPVSLLTDEYKYRKEAYIQYLVYANKQFLRLIDNILANSTRPPVIVLISDHGFRQFNEPTDKKYYFMTLNAVYLPDKNYKGFYNGMSNVNLFRTILNAQFGQQLPMLKDSSTFLFEPELDF